MVTIRFFKTREQAEQAKEVLAEGGIEASVIEDAFYGVPIQEYGVPARIRLQVADEDLNRAAKYLAEQLKRKRE
jgi:hypothetical protein